MNNHSPVYSQRRIFWFWIPLALMWIMMAVEQPIITAVIARLPDPEINLAAFGVSFSLALLVESPIIMLLTAGTALARGKHSYERLLMFTHLLALGLTGAHLLISLTPLYGFILRRIIGAPSEIIELSRLTFLLMTPWSAAIAYRRLWQGVLIRFDRTAVIPLTIGARLLVNGTILLMGLVFSPLAGAGIAAVGLSIGVITAAGVSYAFARSTIRNHLSSPTVNDTLTWKGLLQFYIPLALSPLIVLAGRPILNIGLARAPLPLKSLAVWPVVLALVFMGRSLALSYQEAVVALLENEKNFGPLQVFTRRLAVALSIIFFLAAVTPLRRLWYEEIAGLRPELAGFAVIPTAVLALVPGMSALISWKRGIFVHAKSTSMITRAVGFNLAVLVTSMFGMAALLPIPGVMIASLSLAASILTEWLYLWWKGRRITFT